VPSKSVNQKSKDLHDWDFLRKIEESKEEKFCVSDEKIEPMGSSNRLQGGLFDPKIEISSEQWAQLESLWKDCASLIHLLGKSFPKISPLINTGIPPAKGLNIKSRSYFNMSK
jgi:hypothetical protein